MRRVILMGAGGRGFHDFNVLFRDDPEHRVVAFTAVQTTGIARRYPPSLAGRLYPKGIPILPEQELTRLIRDERVDEVVLAYSDLSHQEVMHRASAVLAADADFRLLRPDCTMLQSTRPVVAVCAVRTGSGKSQTSRRVGRILRDAGAKVVLVRHPMPYGDLERIRVQRFATLADIDAAHATIEEREEYEAPVQAAMTVYAGVDYAEILEQAQAEAEVIVWDGGNNDLPFFRPDLLIVVVDPLRAGQELKYYPGETNLRLADVVVVNKLDSADPASIERVVNDVASINPEATIVRARSPVQLEHGPSLVGAAVLVIEDGRTITYGGMPFGAGMVAAQRGGAGVLVDPRPYAVGSIADTFSAYPHIGSVLPAMGYSDQQLRELEETINAAQCDVVVTGTPIDLTRLIASRHPIRHATYELEEVGEPTLDDVLAPIITQAQAPRAVAARPRTSRPHLRPPRRPQAQRRG
jgi:predicted GTPase